MMTARILIVDDEPDMLDNCTRILTRLGYECQKAENGEVALGLFERQRPDLVLTDLKMPGWMAWRSWLASTRRIPTCRSS
jgi:two-component system response regulator AtoC